MLRWYNRKKLLRVAPAVSGQEELAWAKAFSERLPPKSRAAPMEKLR